MYNTQGYFWLTVKGQIKVHIYNMHFCSGTLSYMPKTNVTEWIHKAIVGTAAAIITVQATVTATVAWSCLCLNWHQQAPDPHSNSHLELSVFILTPTSARLSQQQSPRAVCVYTDTDKHQTVTATVTSSCLCLYWHRQAPDWTITAGGGVRLACTSCGNWTIPGMQMLWHCSAAPVAAC